VKSILAKKSDILANFILTNEEGYSVYVEFPSYIDKDGQLFHIDIDVGVFKIDPGFDFRVSDIANGCILITAKSDEET